VNKAQTAIDLVQSADNNPVIKADLQTLFDSYSHNPIVMGLVPVLAGFLTQEKITVDSTLLTVAVGAAVTGAGYLYQYISMKMRKPAA
jgi:hypothetical protein